MMWTIESDAGATVAGSCTDGWDAANVRISTDGGETWALLNASGLGNDYEYLKANLPDFSPELVRKWGGDTPHNELLHFGIQSGVLGMVFAIFFYFSLIRRSYKILIHQKLQSQTLAIGLFSFSIGIFLWSLANDVILAGYGSLAILITAFTDKIYGSNEASY